MAQRGTDRTDIGVRGILELRNLVHFICADSWLYRKDSNRISNHNADIPVKLSSINRRYSGQLHNAVVVLILGLSTIASSLLAVT